MTQTKVQTLDWTIRRMTRRRNVTAITTLTAIAGFCESSRADHEYESHYDVEYVNNPQWGAEYDVSVEFELFDTQGGTRQLVAMEYFYILDYIVAYGQEGNTDSVDHYAFASSRIEYSNTHNGSPFLPSPNHPGFGAPLFSESQYFFNRPANSPANPGAFHRAGGPFEYFDDPTVLAAFTGAGSLTIDNHLKTFVPSVMDRDTFCGLYPDSPLCSIPISGIYDPSVGAIELTQLGAGFEIYYYYETIPAPGAAVMLGGAILGIGSRRRSRRA